MSSANTGVSMKITRRNIHHWCTTSMLWGLGSGCCGSQSRAARAQGTGGTIGGILARRRAFTLSNQLLAVPFVPLPLHQLPLPPITTDTRNTFSLGVYPDVSLSRLILYPRLRFGNGRADAVELGRLTVAHVSRVVAYCEPLGEDCRCPAAAADSLSPSSWSHDSRSSSKACISRITAGS
jgi:hypothetical protein